MWRKPETVIPPKYYNSLIGADGKLIHSIMDSCGGVAIKFPQVESPSDKVMVRGPQEDVKKACQQLLELTTERQLSNYSEEVHAKPQHHKFLIGKNGSNINPLNPELNPICYLLALLGAHHFFHVSRIRVKLLTFGLLMSYIYGAPILDVSRSHTTTQHSR